LRSRPSAWQILKALRFSARSGKIAGAHREHRLRLTPAEIETVARRAIVDYSIVRLVEVGARLETVRLYYIENQLTGFVLDIEKFELPGSIITWHENRLRAGSSLWPRSVRGARCSQSHIDDSVRRVLVG
jgi:hypothetical protein